MLSLLTQGHPTFRKMDEGSCHKNSSWPECMYTCRCREDLPGVTECIKGKDIKVAYDYWAGSIDEEDVKPVRANDGQSIVSWTDSQFEKYLLTLNKSECSFGIAQCRDLKCSSHDFKPWLLSTNNPCRAGYHRAGLFCQKCEKGFVPRFGNEVGAFRFQHKVEIGYCKVTNFRTVPIFVLST